MKKNIDYPHLLNRISYITLTLLIICNAIYSCWVIKTGRFQTEPYYGRVVVGGFLIPVVYPVIRFSIIRALKYVAKRRDDNNSF